MTEYVIEQLTAKDGQPSLKINDYSIHSRYSPVREAEIFIKKHYKPHHTHIFFGYGAGHFHEAFKKIRQHSELFITIDPLFDNKKLSVCENHQQDYIYNSKSITMLEFLLEKLEDQARTSYTVVCASNYDKLFPLQYKQLLQKVKDIQEFNRINDYTLFRFSKDWQKNLKLNLIHLTKDPSLKELKDCYTVPVVIAASGPSLLKQLPLVKQYRDKIILISAGSTTKVLLDQEITPDFIVSMDGGIPNYDHFKEFEIKNSRLIYSFQNHWKIRESFKKQAFACNVDGYIGVEEYLQNIAPNKIPTIIGGATVANFSFSIAQYISSGPIAFIGQDLAFTGNKTHVGGHSFSKEIDLESQRGKQYFYTDGYYGEQVLTSPPMYSMKLNFEKMIIVHQPKNVFYNCTEGGATLKGYEQIPFKQFCAQYAHQDIVNELPTYEPCVAQKDLIIRFEREKELLTEAIELYEEAIEAIHNNKLEDAFKAKTLAILEKADERVKVIIDETAVGTILTPTLFKLSKGFLEKENETKRQTYNRLKAQNLALYEGSTEAFEKVITYIDEALEKLKEMSE